MALVGASQDAKRPFLAPVRIPAIDDEPERQARRSPPCGGARARALVPGVGALIGAVFLALALTTDSFALSMVFLGFEYLFAEAWFGPTLSLLQGLLPQSRQGIASSLFLFVGSMFGSAAPLVLGLVLDASGGSGTAEGVRSGLLAASGGTYLLCTLGFGALYQVLGKRSAS